MANEDKNYSSIDFWRTLRDLSDARMKAISAVRAIGLTGEEAQQNGIYEVKALIERELNISAENKTTEKHYAISTEKLERAKICIHGNLIHRLTRSFNFIGCESELSTGDIAWLYDHISKLVEINNLLLVRREFEDLLLKVDAADIHLTDKEMVAANNISQQLNHFLDKDLSFELKLNKGC
ncbi:hypothetical protein AB6H27_15910 [Providencia huaxiensis]|uniref:hypothetical protein n=1 Tax=Providencia huaxiensis TaxID=2027290 RepID=UPI0024AC68D3|nr:hypothetical protein [Providencia rettgeri]ELR5125448.1 hypothetical protein [Providencia rettgeri]ELR5198696.1 hypothetical protein [Providencia rettgeri]ELR5282780.1 hypothetical protein [Providencia rettgeri]ELS4583639.1 hypothetical protein [Providencia rettgeri]